MADTSDIEAVLDAVHEAYRRRDAKAAVAPYAADAAIFDLAPPLAHAPDADGVEAWLSTWSGSVEHEVRALKIVASGDAAFAHGFVRVRAHTHAREEASWWMRMTLGLTRESGRWTIVHEHTSVPFAMDGSFLAVMDLEP